MKRTIPRPLSSRARSVGRITPWMLAAFGAFGVASLTMAAPAWAAGESVGTCAIEAVQAVEEEYGSLSGLDESLSNLEDGLEDGSKDAFKKLESDLEHCLQAPNPIIPELDEIIWGGAAFLILLAFMRWKGYPAVKGAMDARAERIRADLDAAETAKTDARQNRSEYEAKLAEAKTEAVAILDDARVQADKLGQEMQERAEADIVEQRARAEADIEASRRQAIDDLRAEVAAIAVAAAERVVVASLDAEVHRKLIDGYIDEVAGSSSGGSSSGSGSHGSGSAETED